MMPGPVPGIARPAGRHCARETMEDASPRAGCDGVAHGVSSPGDGNLVHLEPPGQKRPPNTEDPMAEPTDTTTAEPEEQVPDQAVATEHEALVEEDVLVEDVSIDGMCGVY